MAKSLSGPYDTAEIRLTLRIRRALYDQVWTEAQRRNRSINGQIETIIQDHFDAAAVLDGSADRDENERGARV